MTPERPALVGVGEIAELLGVRRNVVDVWRNRGKLPPPDYTVSGSPIWRAETIEVWMRERGEEPEPEPEPEPASPPPVVHCRRCGRAREGGDCPYCT